METDQPYQLDALINQSTRALNRNQEPEETDASTMSRRDNRSPSPLDNRDTQTAIIKVKKEGCQSDITITSEAHKPKSTTESESMVSPQKLASAYLTSIEKQRSAASQLIDVVMILILQEIYIILLIVIHLLLPKAFQIGFLHVCLLSKSIVLLMDQHP